MKKHDIMQEIDEHLLKPFLVRRYREYCKLWWGREVADEHLEEELQLFGPTLYCMHRELIERTYSELKPRLAKYTKKERRFHFDCMKDMGSWFDYQFPPISKRMKVNIRKLY